ncbi:MAG: PQQ-binding-like beta-propeller repeat protein [Planctomycetota bacterium]|nr:PQQ-binding-like beta-propeller repeat protein [Planctomycetota bacterium]
MAESRPLFTDLRSFATLLVAAGLTLAGGCASREGGAAQAPEAAQPVTAKPTTPAPVPAGGASTMTPERPKPAPRAMVDGVPVPLTLSSFDSFFAMGYTPEWVGYPVLPRGRRLKFVDPSQDIVIAHETGNSITVMDAQTGANRWTLDMGGDLEKFVGNIRSAEGDIVCCSQGEVFLLDAATGVIKDRQRLAVIVNTRPVLARNTLVFGAPTGDVLAHDLSTGFKRWAYRLSGSITANPVEVGSGVGVVSENGEVIILDPASGSAMGRGSIFSGLAGAPVAGDGTMFVAALDQSLWAFDAGGREPRWRHRTATPLRDQPVFHEGRVYLSIPDRGMTAFDAATGKIIWTSKNIFGTLVAQRNNRLVVWEHGKVASVLDPQRGDVLERLSLPKVDMLIADTFVDGNLYAVSLRGEIAKYSPRR